MLLFCFSLFLNGAIDSDAVFDKAHNAGFFYRRVSFTEVDTCEGHELCFEANGVSYSLKRKDKVEISSDIKDGKLKINIVPDNAYISYYLYIEHRTGVHRIQMTKRNIVIDKGVANIIRIQVVGEGAKGPVILYTRQFKEPETKIGYVKNFDESLKRLRQRYSRPLLKKDVSLKKSAEKALKRLQKEGLVHYSSKSGGLRHTGIRKSVIGENLFHAGTIEKGWEMMIKSPSHLYNLINPSYASYYIIAVKDKDFFSGAIVFSN